MSNYLWLPTRKYKEKLLGCLFQVSRDDKIISFYPQDERINYIVLYNIETKELDFSNPKLDYSDIWEETKRNIEEALTC